MKKVFFVLLSSQLLSVPLCMAADADIDELETIHVTSSLDAYNYKNVSTASRTDTPVENIPQSVISVSRKLIEDQGAETLSSALRNVSNVSAIDNRDANNTGFRIRGFTTATVVDGVAMPGYFPNQEGVSTIDRIDVIKGPAGGLFGSSQGVGGSGTLGGTVAITTAAPTGEAGGHIGVRSGSYDEKGVDLDVNQPLSDAFSVRLTGELSDAESETDDVYLKRKSLAPSLKWQPDEDTRLLVRLRYLDNATLDYSGLPVTGTLDDSAYRISRDTFVTAEGLPETTNVAKGINIQWEDAITNHWVFSLLTAYNETEIDQRGVFPVAVNASFCFGGWGGVGPDYYYCGARLWDQWQALTVSPALTGTYEFGKTKHVISAGVDYERTEDDAFMTYSGGFGLLSLATIDIRNPVNPVWIEPSEPDDPDQQSRYESSVVYVQDQIELGNWSFLASLRHSHIEVDDSNAAWGIDNQSSTSKATPRAGLVYKFTSQISAFAGYSEGIKVPTVSIFSEAPSPEEYQQREVGLRLIDAGGVSATLAVFDLTRQNATVADPLNLGFSIQTGEQQSRGVDLDVMWQATPAWSWLLAMTEQQAEITRDSNVSLKDNQLFNVPDQSARLATRYEFLEGVLSGVGVGLGVTYSDELPGNATNTFYTPSYAVWDLQTSYAVDKLRFGINVYNLFDKDYYVPSTYFGGGQVIPALPLTVMATASYHF